MQSANALRVRPFARRAPTAARLDPTMRMLLHSPIARRWMLLVLAASTMCRLDSSLADDPQRTSSEAASDAFFENRIRPVLVEHCYACHSVAAEAEGDLQASLLVDSRAGLLRGGDSGPAVVPGDPSASVLLEALRYESFEMPPSGPLDEEIIADFRRWIAAGATDPRREDAPRPRREGVDWETARDHWAYRPLPRRVSLPRDGAASPIDAYIERRWEAGAEAAPRADRVTLIRRLHFDLTGMPPTIAEIEAFLADRRPDAYQRLVARLIASPEFGEHWGRHWLDLARYAESVTLRGLVQHQAWRYRDYVIDAWNHDLPYDQFIAEQIAGDLMPSETLAERQRRCIATGFLTLGNHNLEDQDKTKLELDAVDEQLRVIGGAILAQTIGCARCHDHKFDPIPTSDYYAMAGVLRNVRTFEHSNVSRWVEKPLPLDPQTKAAIAEHQRRRGEVESQIDSLQRQLDALGGGGKSVPLKELRGIVVDDAEAELIGAWTSSQHTPRFVAAGYRHDDNAGQGTKSASFRATLPRPGRYAVRISYSAGSNRAANVPISVEGAAKAFHTTINQRRQPPIDQLWLELGEFHFDDRAAAVVVQNTDTDGHVIVDAVQFLPRDAELAAAGSSSEDAAAQRERDAAKAELRGRLKAARERLASIDKAAPAAPRYMGVVESETIRDIPIRIRGGVHRHGEVVARGVLQIARGECELTMPEDQSGRLQLAAWLTDPTNPLTARVAANRIWGWLCGEWIVRSPDNFGTTGTPPTHPQLLDYLARRLIDQQWSAKALIGEIVCSDAYRRDSVISREMRLRDPENKLWLRAVQKRITAESLMDAMQQISGRLDRRMGGKTLPAGLSADYGYRYGDFRRTVYWPALRNAPPEILEAFDGANPSLVTGRRDVSTVPTQSLFMMNHPRVRELSMAAAERLLAEPAESTERRIERMYLRTLGRAPNDRERALVARYLRSRADETTPPQRWSEAIQALLCTIDFQYLR